jgi:anti-sigma factor RsiW
MTCRQCQRLLSPYLDNALPTDERGGVLAHLAQCSACTERLRQLESNRQLLRVLPAAEVTRSMELLLQSRIQNLGSKVQGPRSKLYNLKSQVSNLKSQSWWRGWGMISAGTLATGAASLFFYFATLNAPPPVSAEEVVESMNELINVLETDDRTRVIYEETEDEAPLDWREELDEWPAGDGRDLQSW